MHHPLTQLKSFFAQVVSGLLSRPFLKYKGEREIIAALHASPTSEQRYKDCIALFEAVFAEEKKERLLFSQEETVFEGLGVLGEDVYLSYYPSEEEDVEARVVWTKRKRPILQGEEIGRLEILAKKGGRVIQTAPLFSRETLDASHWMRNTMVVIVLLLGVWQIGRGIRKALTSRGEDLLDRDR